MYKLVIIPICESDIFTEEKTNPQDQIYLIVKPRLELTSPLINVLANEL